MKYSIIPLLLLLHSWFPSAAGQNAPHITELRAQHDSTGIVVREDLGAHFRAAGVHGTFVLYDMNRDGYLVYNRERADSAYIPASTFKIFNSLVALETRAIDDVEEKMEWDGVEREVEMWNRDHDLRSAFKYSAVWFYQELARRIGEGRMWHYIQAAEFGNVNIDGGIDRFWLDGELRISATEQVLFLRRLHGNDLPFSQRSIEIVKDIMLVEENEEYALRAKSGWGTTDSGQIGWWIGYVERGDDTYYFSANVDILRDEDASARTSVPRAILRELGIL